MTPDPSNLLLNELEADFDDDLAKSLLDLSIEKTQHPDDILIKSVYNFDLESPDGVDRLLELLPIIDFEILKEVYQDIFPGYPLDTLNPRMARIELKGYFMDYLDAINKPNSTQEDAPEGGSEEPELSEEGGMGSEPEPG